MNMSGPVKKVHWNSFAHQWDYLYQPCALLPRIWSLLNGHLRELSGVKYHKSLAVLILGVTREFATLAWPAGTAVTALDQTPYIIQHVWPGSTASIDRVVCGDWLDPPLAPRAFAFIAGDGVLSMLPFDRGYRRLAAAMASLAREGAIWNLRLHVRPLCPESPASVIDDLMALKIGSFHAFKLRLAMALHGDDDANGVRVADVWRYWEAAGVDVQEAGRTWMANRGHPHIDAYRDSPVSYSFSAVRRGYLGSQSIRAS